MSVFKIEAYETNHNEKELIMTATVKNGQWKVRELVSEDQTETPLTINTLHGRYYLCNPCKDYIPQYDWDKYEETGELVEIKQIWRVYDSFIEYLTCRLNNFKENLKIWDEESFECILMRKSFKYSELGEESEVVFKNGTNLEVIFKKVD